MTTTIETSTTPRIGMVATVRNRRGILSCVRPFDGEGGRLHLVDIEYNDGDHPLEESLLWEREPGARLLPPSALPEPDQNDPMQGEDLLALLRACRWTARMPFIDPDGSGPMDRLPVSSPFHGAVQVEDYQLVPLLKALRMPRVSLLIADDVGLGKTIEAGLILSELLLRRRIRRVLVMTPASLRVQWRDELWNKFALPFEIVDRTSTLKLRRQIGLDANPWRSHSRIVTSYHYLKQPDVLEQFRAASRADSDLAHLPWDLLIVDEAHNLTPVPIGEESDLCKMLRQVAPLFEHRLFLTATPHNGHTRSFTGLLEMLDPVRFSQTDRIQDAMGRRVPDVLIRRLKREINERSDPKRFCDREPPRALTIQLEGAEQALSLAFAQFRNRVRSLVQSGPRRRRRAGNFAIEILGKRLLSCPVAFAESWRRCRAGMDDTDDVTAQEVITAKQSMDEETVDDREAASRAHAASSTVGAWLRPLKKDLSAEIEDLDRALKNLGLLGTGNPTDTNPAIDTRYAALRSLIQERLQTDGAWRDDERLVIFTEYKTTLDYLLRRLRQDSGQEDRILYLYGGMDDHTQSEEKLSREEIKAAFNDPANPVRILVATDAASEGLNLQETARYLLHYDVPWNPARLEQRNGRLDRHGQARDVTVWHFVSTEDQDLAFLDLVVKKVDAIREDLGATGEVFDEITHRRLIEGESLDAVRNDLDTRVEAARTKTQIPRDSRSDLKATPEETDPAGDLEAIAAELDYAAEALHKTLDAAMAISAGRPRVSEPDPEGRSTLVLPLPPAWHAVVDDSLRRPAPGAGVGRMPGLAFDAGTFIQTVGGRPVFRPRRDTVLMHLAHPMMQRALTALTRQRFPGSGLEREASRWSVTQGEVPSGTDALLLLSVEELAVNELRETFHHWVRTIRYPVQGGRLEKTLPHLPAKALRRLNPAFDPDLVEQAQDIWIDVSQDIRDHLKTACEQLTARLGKQLDLDHSRAIDQENERYKSRQGEISALIQSSTLTMLDREIEELKRARAQGVLFDQAQELERLDRSIEQKQEELKHRQNHYEEVKLQLQQERERIVKHLIPRRHTIRGEAQIMPVAVEIILPGGGQ